MASDYKCVKEPTDHLWQRNIIGKWQTAPCRFVELEGRFRYLGEPCAWPQAQAPWPAAPLLGGLPRRFGGSGGL